MQFNRFKLRFRRRLRRGQKQVEDLGLQAEAGLERHFFKRLSSLGPVWRFILGWTFLVVLLIGCLVAQIEALSRQYQTLEPIPGGVYTEGVLGTFTNANPLFATSEVDTTVSHLLFAGLFKYDEQNRLVGDLASSWQVDSKGTTYTVHLKPHLTWQDGQPLTADDVVFTYQAIQNPDAQSPLFSSWQDITVSKVDAHTVTFTLPNPLSSFLYDLTNGIVPAHLLASIQPSEWRSADFNTLHPVGAGPFEWSALQVANNTPDSAQVLIALKPFEHYEGGIPKLDSFVVHSFASQNDLLAAFRGGQLTAMTGLNDVPSDLANDTTVQKHSFLLTAATYAFFNTESPLLADRQVRQALVRGVNTVAILKQLGYATKAVREPLLTGQLAYNPRYAQAGYNPVAAAKLLDSAGWKVGADGVRSKKNVPLELSLYATSTSENQHVAQQLAGYWRALGVRVNVNLQTEDTFQNTLAAHNYDIVLHGVSIGVDPDVFVYWDSSQTDPRSSRLNFSLYKSATANAALEAGRTRLEPALRVLKYRPFLQAWQKDAPALGLYQPRFLYITHGQVYGLSRHVLNSDTDRFDNVQNWMIRTAKVTNP